MKKSFNRLSAKSAVNRWNVYNGIPYPLSMSATEVIATNFTLRWTKAPWRTSDIALETDCIFEIWNANFKDDSYYPTTIKSTLISSATSETISDLTPKNHYIIKGCARYLDSVDFVDKNGVWSYLSITTPTS